jgi:hypothetical protein
MNLLYDSARGVYRDHDSFSWSGHDRFTAFVGEPGWEIIDSEEIDVDARNRDHAKEIAEAAIDLDYGPGLVVLRIDGPRVGLYM